MDKIKKNREKELEWLNSGRVTTDTVHRRFEKKNNLEKMRQDEIEKEGEKFYCIECGYHISAAGGKNSLQDHFTNVTHKHYDECVYCSRPAHLYRWKDKIEVYHNC